MIKEATLKIINNKNLSFLEAKAVMNEIFSSEIPPSQIAAFLVALKIKGETEDEISAAATVVRERSEKINVKAGFLGIDDNSQPIMDTCGTGGSGLNKFNISTATAFVVSAYNVRVVKHGNRAMSSTCGSADVLEALGINVRASSSLMQQAVKTIGIGFLFAPLYHPALGKVAKIRREIGVRTIFNILGPLCNPASSTHQLLGVYDRNLLLPMARVLKKLGIKKAFVVCGKDLLDEISLTGLTKVCFLNNKKISIFSLTPASFGLKKINLKNILVKGTKESAKMIKSVLAGDKSAARDVILANASACFYILGRVKNFKEGVKLASELIDKGQAKDKFLSFKKFLEKNA